MVDFRRSPDVPLQNGGNAQHGRCSDSHCGSRAWDGDAPGSGHAWTGLHKALSRDPLASPRRQVGRNPEEEADLMQPVVTFLCLGTIAMPYADIFSYRIAHSVNLKIDVF